MFQVAAKNSHRWCWSGAALLTGDSPNLDSQHSGVHHVHYKTIPDGRLYLDFSMDTVGRRTIRIKRSKKGEGRRQCRGGCRERGRAVFWRLSNAWVNDAEWMASIEERVLESAVRTDRLVEGVSPCSFLSWVEGGGVRDGDWRPYFGSAPDSTNLAWSLLLTLSFSFSSSFLIVWEPC